MRIIPAAGGLLWRKGAKGTELTVIHRSRYDDWTLPKGKFQPGESWLDCARREIEEETGFAVEVGDPAGWLLYSTGESFKLVRFWNMTPVGESRFQPSEEVATIEWLLPREAVKRLCYEGERMLAQANPGPAVGVAWSKRLRAWIRKQVHFLQYRRLRAELAAYRAELEARTARAQPEEWALAVFALLVQAQQALDRVDIDAGWLLLDAARRQELEGLDQSQLRCRAQALRREAAAKLHDWRKEAVLDILKDTTGSEGTIEPGCLREAMRIRDEHQQNTHFKVSDQSRQLSILSITTAVILLVVLGRAYWASGFFDGPSLLAILCFGALGGSVSGMMSVSAQVLKPRIPVQLLSGWLTVIRPIIGAAAAVAVFAFLKSGAIAVKGIEGGYGYVAVAFASGFSDRLVLRAVGKLAGGQQGKESKESK